VKTYRIQRLRGSVLIDVLLDRPAADGTIAYSMHGRFDFGYEGRSPARLARAIVSDLAGTEMLPMGNTERVHEELVAQLAGDGPHELAEFEIRRLLEDGRP